MNHGNASDMAPAKHDVAKETALIDERRHQRPQGIGTRLRRRRVNRATRFAQVEQTGERRSRGDDYQASVVRASAAVPRLFAPQGASARA